jgi:hypothetical protein
VWEGCELDVDFGEDYGYVGPFCSCVSSRLCHMVNLVVAFTLLVFVLEVSKVGKLLLYCEDSGSYGGGGGNALGSVLVWTI